MKLKNKSRAIYESILGIGFPIPFFDAYELTLTKETSGIAMLMYSTIYNRNEIYFGILVAFDHSLEINIHSKQCLEVIKDDPLQDEILKAYPNWGLNFGLAATLVNEKILLRAKYINFKTPYKFNTPSINSFESGYDNIVKNYKEGTVNLIGCPDVEGIESSLLFIEKTIIAYHNKKPISVNDPYGLSDFVNKNEREFKIWAKKISFEHAIKGPLLVDFIWAGGDIKPFSSVANLEKFLVVYFIGYYDINLNKAVWREPVFSITDKSIRLYDIRTIKQYRISCLIEEKNVNAALLRNFNKEVEDNCPIANYFGEQRKRGAGVIWHVEFSDKLKYYFLIKNNAIINENKNNREKFNSFLDYALTQNRFEEVAKTIGIITPKNLPTFITELYTNILLSEEKYIKNNSFDLEDLEQQIWLRGAKWFRSQYFSK